ncbi:MAG: CoA-binding protein [Verrucomicrobiales bacterium]|nr:CoA-binding protein [Verrucomicrobiales bacterium]
MKDPTAETVVLVGASDDPERYAHKALVSLLKHGHHVIPLHPKLTDIGGIPVLASLEEVTRPVDTVTLYAGPKISAGLLGDLVKLSPRRVIFNPGAENPLLAQELAKAGIASEEACTLVLLASGQFSNP